MAGKKGRVDMDVMVFVPDEAEEFFDSERRRVLKEYRLKEAERIGRRGGPSNRAERRQQARALKRKGTMKTGGKH
ncbi:hypothetical protein [Burkholderia gladioli]|uniref:hypothetical protein n=1 Tax=Burkholderia gladioli TaxID=28095 RepID=UPI00163E7CCC|nr:hypothetical protein [Burkholderia gladioli]